MNLFRSAPQIDMVAEQKERCLFLGKDDVAMLWDVQIEMVGGDSWIS